MRTIRLAEAGSIPAWVRDHDSFRRWACSDDFPERGRFGYLDGILWVDLSRERLIHNRIKTVISAVLTLLSDQESLGLFFGDRMILTNADVELSTAPDGMLVARQSFEGGRVRLENGDDSLEVIGTPDMVLEIISSSSVEKDTEHLMRLYAEAGIAEYWLVDARGAEPMVNVHRLDADEYRLAPQSDGWLASAVFSKQFKLIRRATVHGVSDFTLEVR